MTGYKFLHHDHVISSGFFPFLLRTSAQLMDMGFSSKHEWAFNYDDEVLIVMEKDEPIACMVFRYTKWNKQIYIAHTFVSFDYRREGIYSRMYAMLKKIALEKKAIKIVSGVHIKNYVMQKCSEKNGRIPLAIVYEDLIKEENDDK